jgi:thiamine biosynthesis lipoprotein
MAPPNPWAMRMSRVGSPALALDSGAVATSGDYEHYLVIDGRRYGHLIDPRTASPKRGVLSATVAGPLGEWGDGLSATLFLLGPSRGPRSSTRFPGSPQCGWWTVAIAPTW